MKPTARPTDDIAGGWWDGVGCWVGSDVMARCWFRFRFWYPSGLQSADRRYWRRLSVVAIVGQEWLRMRGSRSSGGVCKNEPANEPSELATLHRNGDAWGEHLTGCGYNEPACVCTWMCQRSGEPSDRRMDALRGVHVQNCHLHLFGTNITLLGIKCSFIKSMWIIHNRNGIGFIGTLVSIMDHQRSYETHASFLPHSAATFHFGNGWRVEKASDLFVCTKHSSMRSLVSGSSSFLLFRLTPLTQLRLIPAAWTWTCHTRIWTPASHLFGLVDEYVRIAGSSSLCLSWNWAAWAALPAHTHTHTHRQTWALLAYPCADNQETEVLAAGCRQTSRAHRALVVAAPQRCIVFAHPTRTNMLGIWTKCTWFCLCILWRVLRLRTNISFGATFCRASLSSY